MNISPFKLLFRPSAALTAMLILAACSGGTTSTGLERGDGAGAALEDEDGAGDPHDEDEDGAAALEDGAAGDPATAPVLHGCAGASVTVEPGLQILEPGLG